MEEFWGVEDDGGEPPWHPDPPVNGPAPWEGPVWEPDDDCVEEADIWADADPYPASLDDESAVPPDMLIPWEDHPATEADRLPAEALNAQSDLQFLDALFDALTRLDSAEAQLHSMRVLAVRMIAALVGADSDDPAEQLEAPSLTAAEIAAHTKASSRTARALTAEALALTAPEAAPVLRAMADGLLDRARAKAILRAAIPVPTKSVAEFMARAVDAAAPEDPDARPAVEGLSRRLRRMADGYSADSLIVRADRAREQRRVDIVASDDGMCWLSAQLPLEVGAAIDVRLQAIARSFQTPDETRTVQQLRADALGDLLLADVPLPNQSGSRTPGLKGGVRTEIVVMVPAASLVPAPVPGEPGRFEFADLPGEILGYGPIDAPTVRRLAADAASWLRMLTDPESGAPLALGRTRYTPPPALRRYLAARDGGCRFPACDKPPGHTEADHTHEWSAGGTTGRENLALLCSEHHRMKTRGHWRVSQIRRDELRAGQVRRGNANDDGILLWRSPLGRRYVTYPGSRDRSPQCAIPGERKPGNRPAPGDGEPPPF